MLPPKVYETLRWLVAIVLPAVSVFIVSINAIWRLSMPSEEISLTIDAIALLVGTIFGLSKLSHDKDS